jgi:hypothetical protein
MKILKRDFIPIFSALAKVHDSDKRVKFFSNKKTKNLQFLFFTLQYRYPTLQSGLIFGLG